MLDRARRVLIVDDDALLCEMLVEGLAEEGWQARFARSADEALACLEAEPFAAIVSDIRMEGGDGWVLLRSVRARGKAPPVILMSSFGPPTVAIRAREEGAFDYLSKPFEMADLLAVLDRAT